jgi:hypothetical protein
MDDFEILNLMIQEEAKVKLDGISSSKSKVVLKEADLYAVTIHGMPSTENVIVIKGDAIKEPKQLFNGEKGECKRADFMIIARFDDIQKYVVFIEMKSRSTTSKEWEIIQQLQGTQCLFAYCREIGKVFWKEPKFLDDYHHRFVSLKNIGLDMRPTLEPQTPINDRPERMLKRNCKNLIQFGVLVGKR